MSKISVAPAQIRTTMANLNQNDNDIEMSQISNINLNDNELDKNAPNQTN